MGNSLCSLFCSFFLFKRGQMSLTLRLQPILVPTPSLCSTTLSKPLPLFVAPISCLCIRGNTTAIPSFVHFITFWIVRQRLSLTACSGRDKSNLPFLLLLFRELCCFLYLSICAETTSCKCQWCRMKAHLLLSPRVLLNSLSLSFSLPISCTHTLQQLQHHSDSQSPKKASKFFGDYLNNILWKLHFSIFITSTRIYDCISCKLHTLWPLKNIKGIKKVFELTIPQAQHIPHLSTELICFEQRDVLWSHESCVSPIQGIQPSKIAMETYFKQ